MPMADLTAERPPLAPELWNFAVVLVICAILAWMLRLLRLLLVLVDMRYALYAQATLHLHGLGPSLSILQNASMWHFQQLLRIKTEPQCAPMARMRMPFEIDTASLRVEQQGSGRGGAQVLSVRIKSRIRCSVQVFWHVRVAALEQICHRAALSASSSSSSVGQNPFAARAPSSPGLLSVRKRLQASSSSLPNMFSFVRPQTRRHRLTEEYDSRGETTANEDDTLVWSPQFFGDTAFTSKSTASSFDAVGGGFEYAVTLPTSIRPSGAAEELQSLRDEVETDGVDAGAGLGSIKTTPPVEPQYGAVLVVRSASMDSAKPATSGTESVLAQCIALDFLPIPTVMETSVTALSPIVLKRLVFTTANVYSPQEIFGGDLSKDAAGECVICLEGDLSVILLPCRHLCVCRVCLQEIDKCPICRRAFSTYVCYDEDGDRNTKVT